MNEKTHEGSTYSPIHIPPFDGLAEFAVEYKHKLKKPFPDLLKIELTVNLHLNESMGSKTFKIMNVVCKYRIKVVDKLTVKDLSVIWHDSAAYLVDIFNSFEKKKFGRSSEILYSSPAQLEKVVAPLVNWFYNNQQN